MKSSGEEKETNISLAVEEMVLASRPSPFALCRTRVFERRGFSRGFEGFYVLASAGAKPILTSRVSHELPASICWVSGLKFQARLTFRSRLQLAAKNLARPKRVLQ